MKKLVTIICAGMTMFSCSNEIELMNNETKAFDTKNLEVSNNVTLNDIQTYMEKGSAIASRNGGNGEIEVITYQNDTVMYLLKYGNGWEMMPGDKRFPIRVAYNDEGTLDYDNMHDGQRAWFENIAEEIHVMKKYGKGIENKYCKVWNSFSKKGKKKESNSRSQNGEWILHNTREESTITEKPHLITTAWHQGVTKWYQEYILEEYNMYCPMQTNREYHRSVGCTAVAGGQVLFHLHKQGWSLSDIPNTAMPIDTIYSFTNPMEIVWSGVEDGQTEAIAKLLGHIGVLSHMNYEDWGSGAYLRNGLEEAFDHYGIECSILDFWDISKIKSDLNSNLPVIVSMTGSDNKNEPVGHTVIIDGYKNITTNYTDVYIYIEDPKTYPGDIYDHDEGMEPLPEEGPTQEESYTVSSNYLYINWGNGSIDNTSYYASHDLYYYLTDETTNEQYRVTFDREKRMLYNLSQKE